MTSTGIGLVISTIANAIVIPAVLGVAMSMGENVLISLIFTGISVARGYVIRRLFNGRSPWQAIRARFGPAPPSAPSEGTLIKGY